MIVDVLERAHHYFDMHPAFARAFEFIQNTDLASLPPGRHEIDGDRVYLSIDHVEGKGAEGVRLEHHRRYIDIQMCIDGTDTIGWMPLDCCRQRAGDFDHARDVGFCDEAPHSWVTLSPRIFAIFFPADAHAPLGGRGPLRKAIVKVLI